MHINNESNKSIIKNLATKLEIDEELTSRLNNSDYTYERGFSGEPLAGRNALVRTMVNANVEGHDKTSSESIIDTVIQDIWGIEKISKQTSLLQINQEHLKEKITEEDFDWCIDTITKEVLHDRETVEQLALIIVSSDSNKPLNGSN